MCPCRLSSYYVVYFYIQSCNFLADAQLCGSVPLLCCQVCTSHSGLCTLTSRLQTICFVLFSLLLQSSRATLVRDTFSLWGWVLWLTAHALHARCMFRPMSEMLGKSTEAGSPVPPNPIFQIGEVKDVVSAGLAVELHDASRCSRWPKHLLC